MGLIKEPTDIDFVIESKPWTDEELAEFRILMAKLKSQRVKVPQKATAKTTRNRRIGEPV